MSDPWTPSSEQTPYRVSAAGPCTPTIVELRLLPLEGLLGYRPGQYILLEDEEGAIAPRSYSIANPPRPDGEISLLVTHVPGGQASSWIHRLTAGETVRVSGPYGTFVDDTAGMGPVLFLAAGSGLAPIRALLEAALTSRRREALTLVLSARGEVDVIDHERFACWRRRDPRFRFLRSLTREAGPPPHGRIPEMLGDLVDGLHGHDVFVAGASGFVTECAAAAEALGAARAHVHTEVFYDEPRSWAGAAPPTTGA
jgi:CDP-4-dehydro-6-deoxyglucose reductase